MRRMVLRASVALGVSALAIGLVAVSASGEDETATRRVESPAPREDPDALPAPTIDRAALEEFQYVVSHAPVLAGTNRQPLTTTEMLAFRMETVISGTIVSAEAAPPVKLTLVPGQDQFDWRVVADGSVIPDHVLLVSSDGAVVNVDELSSGATEGRTHTELRAELSDLIAR